MRLTLRAAEMESRNALRAHGVVIASYMTIVGLGFLRGHPIVGTKPVFEVLDDVASPLVWGLVLTSIGMTRLVGMGFAIFAHSNPRPSLFSAFMTGFCSVVWAFMAMVYYTIAGGGGSLTLLAIIDAITCLYASRMTGTASGRRSLGRTIGE